MSAIDATVINVALNTLEHDLHSSVAGVQWVMTGYLLSVAGVIPVSGWASRRFGARRVYLCALAMFGVTSGLCALAGSLTMLIGCRLLQGVAGGMLVPIGQLIAAELGGPNRMGRMISRVWMVSSLGSMLGPTLGGVIISGLGWRWIFLINVPVSLLTTVAAFYLLPQMPARPAGRLDIGGLMRLSIGVPATVFGLAQAEATGSLLSPSALLPLGAGVLLVLDFIRHALRSKYPLLNVRLYARRTFTAGAVSIFVFDLAWFGTLVLLPLSFQQLRHATPVVAGLLLAPQGFGTVVGMVVAGRASDGRRGLRLGAAGGFVFVVTTAAVSVFGPNTPDPLICVTLLVAGFAAGLSWVPATAICYRGLAPEEISHASPLVAVMMRLGASFGTAIAAIILQAQLSTGGGRHPAAHAIGAYHSSFHFEALISLAAALLFVGLCLRASRSSGRALPETRELKPQFAVEV
jgi:EmrB/QacA subfamily drug resistance transporter